MTANDFWKIPPFKSPHVKVTGTFSCGKLLAYKGSVRTVVIREKLADMPNGQTFTQSE